MTRGTKQLCSYLSTTGAKLLIISLLALVLFILARKMTETIPSATVSLRQTKQNSTDSINVVSIISDTISDSKYMYSFIQQALRAANVEDIYLCQVYPNNVLSEFAFLERVSVLRMEADRSKMSTYESNRSHDADLVKLALDTVHQISPKQSLYVNFNFDLSKLASKFSQDNKWCSVVSKTGDVVLLPDDVLLRDCLRSIPVADMHRWLVDPVEDARCNLRQKETAQYVLEDDIKYETSDIRALEQNGKFHIGIGIPMNGRSSDHVDEIPLLTIFLPSFISSVTLEEVASIKFTILLGIDRGDSLLNRLESRLKILNTITESTRDMDVSVVFQVFDDSGGKVVYIWNGLFEASIRSYGCTHFYQMNDDMKIISKGWLTEFLSKLREYDNIGVVGPTDLRNPKILTASFVSFTHYEVFGFLYPEGLINWFSDDWITEMYAHQQRKIMTNVTVFNKKPNGPSYQPCRHHKKLANHYIATYEQALVRYLEEQKMP